MHREAPDRVVHAAIEFLILVLVTWIEEGEIPERGASFVVVCV